jgi:hypothetical protein
VIFLISASSVARSTGISHWCWARGPFLVKQRQSAF